MRLRTYTILQDNLLRLNIIRQRFSYEDKEFRECLKENG
jgi:hypothetical protein